LHQRVQAGTGCELTSLLGSALEELRVEAGGNVQDLIAYRDPDSGVITGGFAEDSERKVLDREIGAVFVGAFHPATKRGVVCGIGHIGLIS
jgi:hypothetical protein